MMADSTGLSTTDTSVANKSTITSDYLGGRDFSQISDHPIEQADWLDVNQKLRQFGYDPVILSHPNKLNGTSSGFIILEEMVAFGLRNTVETLLADCERKQNLMQELVSSSNKLQRELDEERNKNKEVRKEVLSLQASLETERIKSQEMEIQRTAELKSHAEQIQKLASANTKMHAQNRDLEHKNAEILTDMQEFGALGKSPDDKFENRTIDDKFPFQRSPQSEREHNRTRKARRNVEIFNEYDQRLSEMHQELEKLRLQVAEKESRAVSKGKNVAKKKTNVKYSNEKADDLYSDILSDYDDDDNGSQAESQSTMTSESKASITSTLSSEISDAGFLYKRLKLTERKFKEAKKLIKELSEENGKLTAEMKKRPKLKEWRKTLVLNKQMENLLRENNLSPGSRGPFGVEDSIKKCTHVDGIDFLPIDVCRGHLKSLGQDRKEFRTECLRPEMQLTVDLMYHKDICNRMDVTNINDISRKLDTLEDSFQLNYKMEKILRNLLRTIKTHEQQQDDESVCSSTMTAEEQRDETQWKCLVPTIKIWREELKKLKVVSDSIKRLSEMLLPWKVKDEKNFETKEKSHEKCSVDDLKRQIQMLADECKHGPVKHRRGPPNKDELIHVVEHFMKLFDVEDISGTFARMNDVYVKHSEMANVLHTVKDLLGLEKNAGAANIVNAVGTLAKAKHLLHVNDLENVIIRLDQYDEFYLAFKSVISSLIEILGVDTVEEIVPAVRALVRFP